MTRIPLLFPSPTGFTLPERLVWRRPAEIEQKNSGETQVMMTFDLTRDYDRRALCIVGLILSNGAVFTDRIRWPLLARDPLPTSDFQVMDNPARGFGVKSRLPGEHRICFFPHQPVGHYSNEVSRQHARRCGQSKTRRFEQ